MYTLNVNQQVFKKLMIAKFVNGRQYASINIGPLSGETHHELILIRDSLLHANVCTTRQAVVKNKTLGAFDIEIKEMSVPFWTGGIALWFSKIS